MAKYGYIKLTVGKDGNLSGISNLRQPEQNTLQNGNVIYVYRGSKSKKLYVGQTKHFIQRNDQHYSGNEEKFDVAQFDEVIVLYSSIFNGSALDDVESQLITYFMADNSKSKKQNVYIDSSEIINRTSGNSVNDYKDRDKIATEVILPFWENELYKFGWVQTATLKEIRTSELVKYSPIKELTTQQMDILSEIIENPHKNFVINGDAGTGKTVLLTHLVAKLIKDRPNIRVAVVVQPNWGKTAELIFKVYGMNSSNVDVLTSTKMIKANQSYDVTVIDESHKLSRRGNKQHPSFNKVYDIDRFSDLNNHFEAIEMLTKQMVLMYDVLQSIRPANISRSTFEKLTKNFEKKYLTTQFRIQTPEGKSYTSEDYINGIKYLLYKDTNLLSKTNFNPNFNRDVFRDDTPDAYFGFFENKPLKNLFDWVEEDRNFHPEHVDRVLGGLVEDWKQSDGKDASITHWHEDDMSRRWNSTQENWVNSEEDDAEDQIGSVFGVQGIDLNKVGVLIGDDLEVLEDGTLFGNRDKFKNVNGKFSKEDFEAPDAQSEFTLFVLNIYYVLLTRGIDGIRIGFWRNHKFKDYLKKNLIVD